MDPHSSHLLTLAASIVSAHVGKNDVRHSELPGLIRRVYDTLVAIEPNAAATPNSAGARRAKPVTPDILVCLECNMRMKMLKRHLITVHQLTPEAYRARNNLSADAPMVTSDYAELRSQLARRSGLGRRPENVRRI
jgi:predicted transcriptional regulator